MRKINFEKPIDIVTVGFPMVEIMRKERDVTFEEIGDFSGPYPSADTCIMLDVAARLGSKTALLGVTGSDTFSNVVIDRLKNDGVDVSHVRTIDHKNTIIVFVRYEKDGTRHYLNRDDSAAAEDFSEEDICKEILKTAKCIHFSGEIILMCSDDRRRRALLYMLENIPDDALVSLDPNFTEWNDDVKDAIAPFLNRADIVFPSEGEASKMMEMENDESACQNMAENGKIVAYKRGKEGCRIYREGNVTDIPAFAVEEVDPTGCGDSFCAGFLTGFLEKGETIQAGVLANAAGALQATKFGPMEGAMYRSYVEEFIKDQSMKGGRKDG